MTIVLITIIKYRALRMELSLPNQKSPIVKKNISRMIDIVSDPVA